MQSKADPLRDKTVGNGDQIWYFGYGSNMCSSVMQRRGLKLLDIQAVKLPGHLLTFDVFGLPYSEPAMASIAEYSIISDETRDPDSVRPPEVSGVAYLLSLQDFRRLVATEGGGVAYKEILVRGYQIHRASEPLDMRTLIARFPRRPNAAPSARYLVCTNSLMF